MMAHNRVLAAYLLGVSFLPSLLPGAVFGQSLPSDPKVLAGDVAISSPSAASLLLQQSSQYGIVDWGAFSIGQGFGVQVNNGTGVTLNRVTGGDASSILGSLTATGSVYLVNPNGIVVGRTGVVNTGGRFVATTLDLSNADLLNGGDAIFAGTSDAYVVNLGQVASLGGDVALLARNVVNQGSLSAPNGTVGVIAGREILMRDAAVADGLFSVKVGGSDTSASESGAIRAAAAELRAKGGNVYALAGNTQGTIEATGVAKVAGRVFLTAGDTGKLTIAKTAKAQNADGSGGTIVATGGTVDMAGTLDASGTAGGRVTLKAQGETQFDGQIFAKGGEGGFVEVSGGHISFAGAVDSGGGTLLIDPDNLEISVNNSAVLVGNSADATLMLPSDITDLLGSQDVVLMSTDTAGEAGSILVTDAVSWSTSHSLTLLASGDIIFNAAVQNNDATGGDLNVVAGWDGSTSFDAATFNSATLASQTLFGAQNGVTYTIGGVSHAASGSVQIADPNGVNAVAVGARTGATRVYANNLTLSGGTGSSSTGVSAELGFNIGGTADQGTVSGDISVRATGDVTLMAGTLAQTGAQIGHIGINHTVGLVSPATAVASGAISVEAGGSVDLEGATTGAPTTSYAMIGHGSLDLNSILLTGGTRSGNIDVTAAGSIVLKQGDTNTNAALIGHSGAAGAAATTSMTAAGFYQSQADLSGGIATVSVPMLVNDTAFGDVRVTTTASGLDLIGTTDNGGCECSTISTPGSLIVQTSGDLTLGTSAGGDFLYSNSGGGSLVLASGGNLINHAGASAIGAMGPGQWITYSDRPDHDTGTLGVLTPDELFFDTTYNPADPLDPGQLTGNNAMVYRQAPVVIVSGATLTYGDTYTPGTISMTVKNSGEVISDPAAWGFSLSAAYVDDSIASFSGDGFVNAGHYVDALKTNVTATASGFVNSYSVGYGILDVSPATITVGLADQTKPYDGVGGYTLTPTYIGWKGTDGTGLISAGPTLAYSGGDGSAGVNATRPANPYTVTASGLTETSGNYVFDTTDTASLAITPLDLTVGIPGSIDKAYDGTSDATLTAADFNLTGFISGEGATVTQTLGRYSQTNAGSGLTVSANLASGDFTANSGTLLSNYVLPLSASGFGNIDRQALSVDIVGSIDKAYDGTASATLTAADFTVTGFISGEGATITQTLGSYGQTNAGNGLTVSANLSASDFAANAGTLLTNYILPDFAAGLGNIDRQQLSAGLLGSIDKTYDGTADATLTAADFNLTGFASGEGATITQTLGSYSQTDAGSGLTVTANLADGDFAANSGTLLSNYILPVSALGLGTIDRRQLSVAFTGRINKVFDGTADATLTAADFNLTGFVSGQGATVTQTLGTYGQSHAGDGLAVSATLAAGDFAAGSGTALSNYVLPVIASGEGAIARKALDITIVGTPTKLFDGTTLATLTEANFAIDGFVLGDSGVVTQTAGLYAAATLGPHQVTANLTPSDISAVGGTDLTNYSLPDVATGPGLIAPQPVAPPPVTRSVDPFSTTPLGNPTGPADVLQVINTETTQQILDEITAGANFCRAFVQQEYAIDCLSDRLQSVADGLSGAGEYSEVRAALENAARKLHALAIANASSVLSQAVARSTSGPLRTSSRPLTAISADQLLTANAEARAIIASTEVVLLRSGADSARRRVAFQQVGQIVGSTATLLRSS